MMLQNSSYTHMLEQQQTKLKHESDRKMRTEETLILVNQTLSIDKVNMDDAKGG